MEWYQGVVFVDRRQFHLRVACSEAVEVFIGEDRQPSSMDLLHSTLHLPLEAFRSEVAVEDSVVAEDAVVSAEAHLALRTEFPSRRGPIYCLRHVDISLLLHFSSVLIKSQVFIKPIF
jgi:hypothetical protein